MKNLYTELAMNCDKCGRQLFGNEEHQYCPDCSLSSRFETPTPQPQPSAETRARELLGTIAEDAECLGPNFEAILETVTTLITKADERDSWPHCQECNFPLQDQGTPNGLVCLLCDVRAERDSFKAKAEALEKLVLQCVGDACQCDAVLGYNCHFHKKYDALLSAITTARKDSE